MQPAAITDTHSEQLSELIGKLPRPVVFTNGCFDILHIGHVTLLEQAANFGRSLVVGLNTDASVRRLGKAPDRPLNNQMQRAHLLAAVRWIDCVVLFDEDTPYGLIERIRPDVLVKGGDWPVESIVGADLVTSHGGRVVSIPFEHQTSTTDLVNRIKSVD